jgi:glycosyltransferase involved in cell wall biosynthesis
MSVYKNDKVEYVRMAIESMLNQTVKTEQYVIVEDGPVDNEVKKLIEQYSKDYSEVFTIVKLPENQGLPVALNEGLLRCRNELVARMDADDISLPKRCEKELELFKENENLVICGCNIDEFSKSPEKVITSRVVPSEYEDIIKFMRRRTPFNHPTVMYKKSKVLENGGYSPEIKRKQDYDLFSRMLVNGCYARNVNESLFLFRADENNYARRKSWQTLKNAFRVYWRHLKRKGCNVADFIVMCGGEILFFVLPQNIMKMISNNFLRKKTT